MVTLTERTPAKKSRALASIDSAHGKAAATKRRIMCVGSLQAFRSMFTFRSRNSDSISIRIALTSSGTFEIDSGHLQGVVIAPPNESRSCASHVQTFSIYRRSEAPISPVLWSCDFCSAGNSNRLARPDQSTTPKNCVILFKMINYMNEN
jgi:hypothetical protein